MNYNDFIINIKKDNLKSVYFFTGDEEYLMEETLKVLKNKYIDESLETLNYIVIDGKDMKFDNIFNACETLPVFSPKKIVLIKDIGEIIENEQTNFPDVLCPYLEGLDDYLLLIIMDRSKNFKKNTKIYRTINKLNGVVEFPKLKGRDLNLWIEKKCKEYKKTITLSNINYFIQQSTYSEYNSTKTLYDLENELIKVASHTLNNDITKDDIDAVLAKTLDTNIFNLLNCITKKDSEGALRIFNEMYVSNEPVQRILFMIIRQLRLILGYKLYKEKGYSEQSIQEKLGIKPFEFRKLSSQSHNFTEEQVRTALENILETDIKQKTSSSDEKLALEMLIINLSYTK